MLRRSSLLPERRLSISFSLSLFFLVASCFEASKTMSILDASYFEASSLRIAYASCFTLVLFMPSALVSFF